MELIDELTDFAFEYGAHKDQEKLREAIAGHIRFNTFVFLRQKGTGPVIALALFNIFYYVAEILEVIVRPDYKNKGLLKRLMIKGLRKWPEGKYFFYVRDRKYPGREQRIYRITDFLK